MSKSWRAFVLAMSIAHASAQNSIPDITQQLSSNPGSTTIQLGNLTQGFNGVPITLDDITPVKDQSGNLKCCPTYGILQQCSKINSDII